MLAPGVAARSTFSASAVTSGPMPSPPTTASLMVRELMPEPYWRGGRAGGGVAWGEAAAAPASPPLSRRSRAIWTARAGEVSRVVWPLFWVRRERRGSGGESPGLAEVQGDMSDHDMR